MERMAMLLKMMKALFRPKGIILPPYDAPRDLPICEARLIRVLLTLVSSDDQRSLAAKMLAV